MSKSLDKADDLLKDQFLNKMLEIDTWKPQGADVLLCEKLIARLDEIIACVVDGCKSVSPDANVALQVIRVSFFFAQDFSANKNSSNELVLRSKNYFHAVLCFFDVLKALFVGCALIPQWQA